MWHRRMGLSVLLFVLLLSITGLALNHNDGLNLDKKYIQTEWILDIYGIDTPKITGIFSLDGDWVYKIGSLVFFNNKKIESNSTKLIAATRFSDMNVIVLEDSILLLDKNGDLIDKLSGDSDLPDNIIAARKTNDRFIIKTTDDAWETSNDFLEWMSVSRTSIKPWIKPEATPHTMKKKILQNYRGNGISYEKLILDLHSGQIFGKARIIVWDVISIGMIILSISGAWSLLGKNRNRKKKELNTKI